MGRRSNSPVAPMPAVPPQARYCPVAGRASLAVIGQIHRASWQPRLLPRDRALLRGFDMFDRSVRATRRTVAGLAVAAFSPHLPWRRTLPSSQPRASRTRSTTSAPPGRPRRARRRRSPTRRALPSPSRSRKARPPTSSSRPTCRGWTISPSGTWCGRTRSSSCSATASC